MMKLIRIFLLIFFISTHALADKVQVFNFTKEEFNNLKVRKVKKLTTYTLGSNENGNFIKAEAEGVGSGLGKEVSINLNKTPFINITWKV